MSDDKPVMITLVMDSHDFVMLYRDSLRWNEELAARRCWTPYRMSVPEGVSPTTWLRHWRPGAQWKHGYFVDRGPAVLLARTYLAARGHAYELIDDEVLCRCNRDRLHCRCLPQVVILTDYASEVWDRPDQAQCARCSSWYPASSQCPCEVLLDSGEPGAAE